MKIVIALALILIACGAAAYFYWFHYLGPSDKWLTFKKVEGQELITKDGRLFLVSGIIHNGSTRGRKFIALRARLFDRQGKAVGQKDGFAGLNLSKDDVQRLQRAELEQRLAEFRVVRAETFTIERGKEVPFSIVFFDNEFSPAKDFTVEIIESPIL